MTIIKLATVSGNDMLPCSGDTEPETTAKPRDMKKSEEQRAAEADVEGFRRKLGPFVTAAETTRMPMVFTSAKASNHPIVFANQAFLDLTGYEEHEVLGQSFDFLMERSTDPEALAEIRTAFAGARGLDTQVRYRCKDGRMVSVQIFISPVRDEDNNVVQHFASFVDANGEKRGRMGSSHGLLETVR